MALRPSVLRPSIRGTAGLAAALAITTAPTAVVMLSGAAPAAQAACYNGTAPLNPYLQSCTIPGPVNKIRGSAPDANAIIACRGVPGCLSYYVNNP